MAELQRGVEGWKVSAFNFSFSFKSRVGYRTLGEVSNLGMWVLGLRGEKIKHSSSHGFSGPEVALAVTSARGLLNLKDKSRKLRPRHLPPPALLECKRFSASCASRPHIPLTKAKSQTPKSPQGPEASRGLRADGHTQNLQTPGVSIRDDGFVLHDA